MFVIFWHLYVINYIYGPECYINTVIILAAIIYFEILIQTKARKLFEVFLYFHQEAVAIIHMINIYCIKIKTAAYQIWLEWARDTLYENYVSLSHPYF